MATPVVAKEGLTQAPTPTDENQTVPTPSADTQITNILADPKSAAAVLLGLAIISADFPNDDDGPEIDPDHPAIAHALGIIANGPDAIRAELDQPSPNTSAAVAVADISDMLDADLLALLIPKGLSNQHKAFKAAANKLSVDTKNLEILRSKTEGPSKRLTNAETALEMLTETLNARRATYIEALQSVSTVEEVKTNNKISELDQAVSIFYNKVKDQGPDASHQALLQFVIPHLTADHFWIGETLVRRIVGHPGSIEVVDDTKMSGQVHAALSNAKLAAIVMGAYHIGKRNSGGDDPDCTPSTMGVLDAWRKVATTDYRKLIQYLPHEDDATVADHVLPIIEIEIDKKTGDETERTWFLDRETLAECERPEGAYVMYPAVVIDEHGESRSLDGITDHHFAEYGEAETEAFYLTMGITLFGYGIPNLLFLLGGGGSGKDKLMSMLSAVHGPMTVSLNPEALTNKADEANDLNRLEYARLATCGFEGGHGQSGAFSPQHLKSITSGGDNPITGRAKYASKSIEIRYRGSLLLYGNTVPSMSGTGGFAGTNRRLTVVPMTRTLPEIDLPEGFTSWSRAAIACAPALAYRSLHAVMQWAKDGSKGLADSRSRMPERWAEHTHDQLLKGARNGFVRQFMETDTEQGTDEWQALSLWEEMIRNVRHLHRSDLAEVAEFMLDAPAFPGMLPMQTRNGRFPIRFIPEGVKRYASTESYLAAEKFLEAIAASNATPAEIDAEAERLVIQEQERQAALAAAKAVFEETGVYRLVNQ